MGLVKGSLTVCLGLLISFIGLIVWNIGLSAEESVAIDWHGFIYFGWGIFICFGLGPLVILYGLGFRPSNQSN